MPDTTSPSTPAVANLRLCRHWRWVRVPGTPLLIGGGPPPMQLEAVDTLETQVEGQWVPVPVVEMPKPEHPAERARREWQAAMRVQMAKMAKDVRPMGKKGLKD